MRSLLSRQPASLCTAAVRRRAHSRGLTMDAAAAAETRLTSLSLKRARSGSAGGLTVRPDIKLTELERSIFGVLVDAKKRSGCTTTIRVVGGWVRDKVLGLESDDIDIALDDMSGAEFAEMVLGYLKRQSGGVQTSRLAVIERNPEQSKHLETATMRIEGVSIDFVGLRAEEYADGSRIPTVRLGTAEEDALRRDLTINALFYEIEGVRLPSLRVSTQPQRAPQWPDGCVPLPPPPPQCRAASRT
jgi:hypothetical protein